MKTADWCAEREKMGRIGNRPIWVLYLSIGIRAIHQVGAAVFLASFLVDGIGKPPSLYLTIVLTSGLALMTTEGMRHRQFYREVSGVATIFKLLLLGAAFHGYLPVTGTILIAFIIASIGSHTPKTFRHRLMY